ncbi:Na-translocating system protein MpsC family protein [Paenibacillus sp. URB8-2]|uniref:Na-translocating system protein MpsC family protein n=1 Tax=Paenibacillus sp. URB8-2 TaxID=2741301 RepID=UPI0015BA39BF|nr:Na-translocating system protein MpsC family protein [Paenibacillus sp. URB8-2]
MCETEFECQEKIRRLVVKIVKHYRGRGPENVKVKLENDLLITIEIRGILSSLSEILMKEGAVDLVAEYWKVLKPYLEREFMSEMIDTLGSRFTYTWKIAELCPSGRAIIIQLNKSV